MLPTNGLLVAPAPSKPSKQNVYPNNHSTSERHQHIMIRPDGRCFILPRNSNGYYLPSTSNSNSETEEQPVSRTYQYRKVMKPMLERKRRARINRCLDELKEIMLTALQAEGENVSKLEKADILELTVRHLHKLRRQRALGLSNEPSPAYADRFRAGFTHCAAEVSQYLASVIQQQQQPQPEPQEQMDPQMPNYSEKLLMDHSSGVKLLQHLGSCIQRIENATFRNEDIPPANPYTTPPSSPSPCERILCTNNTQPSVWRPW